MGLAKWIIFGLSLIMVFVTRILLDEYDKKYQLPRMICGAIAIALGVTFCILMAIMHWNVMIIPKIFLYISVCLYVFFKEEFEECGPFYCGLLITVIAFIITGIVYCTKIEVSNDVDISTTRQELIAAKDTTSTSSSMSGFLVYACSTSSEKTVYKYYYQLDDGGIKLGEVSSNDTTLYLLENGETPYIETVVTTTYCINYNNKPATHCLKNSKTTYKLYVPADSIINVYEFDLE